MPATRTAVAEKIAMPLHEAEHAVDSALAQAAQLTLAMATGRAEARVAAQVGQDAFDALGQAVSALTAARRHLVNTHLALEGVRLDLNLPITAHGDESEKVGFTGATRRLHIAA